jgi:succinyl-CoA synthetase beta subunit
MLLTSREQALLTIAVDKYMTHNDGVDYRTVEMWSELYDAIIDADIDDVGDEYNPFAEFSEDYEVCDLCGEVHADFDADFEDWDSDSEDYEADEAAFKKWLETLTDEKQKKIS